MPSTENATLQRIQQEINESIQREKEFRRFHIATEDALSTSDNNNVGKSTSNGATEVRSETAKQPVILQRAKSTTNLAAPAGSNGFRRFAPNPQARGVMQKFIKARGKLATNNNSGPLSLPQAPQNGTGGYWTSSNGNGNGVIGVDPLSFEPAKVTVQPGKKIRNGYVPVQERLKKEVQEYQQRENELRSERRKSQPDLMAALLVTSPSPPKSSSPTPSWSSSTTETTLLRGARSMGQLFFAEDAPALQEDTASAPPSLLKPARSLADLLDDPEEAPSAPGTHSLILQFERMGMMANGHRQDRT